jgi:hypothetical protein
VATASRFTSFLNDDGFLLSSSHEKHWALLRGHNTERSPPDCGRRLAKTSFSKRLLVFEPAENVMKHGEVQFLVAPFVAHDAGKAAKKDSEAADIVAANR